MAHLTATAGVDARAPGASVAAGLQVRLEVPMFADPEFDLVAAWSVDRLGRSLQHLVAFLGELHALKIDLYLHQQGIDTTTPAGEAMFQMMGVFAQFERAMIQERVKSGLSRARAGGKRLGRPPVAARKRAEVLKLRRDGQSVRKIAQAVGLAPGTVQRIRG